MRQATTAEDVKPDLETGAARPHVVIVGGGFTGATFATLLMRQPQLAACRITMVEPRDILGAGIAYSAEDPLHRVNIVASRMAALPDAVADFDTWLKQAGRLDGDPEAIYSDWGIFPARAQFGLYSDDLLHKTVAGTAQVAFQHLKTRVETAESNGHGYRLRCASGDVIEADVLILATGHPKPRLPWPLSSLPATPRIIVNPWAPGAVDGIEASADVLIVGTGLTMGDVIASLRRQGHRAPVTALSRHGLTPRPRPAAIHPIEGLSFVGKGTVVEVLHAVRVKAREVEAAGGSWFDVFDALRQQNSAIWQGWSDADRRRFQRHLRPYWDVHRFQAAPQIHDLVAQELASGGLTIVAATMAGVALNDGRLDLTFRRRGEHRLESRAFDVIVNCTGATSSFIDDSPLLTSLKTAALIQPDAFGSGIDVDVLGRPKTPSGISANLYALGPAIRGCLGEISGALEIATHVQSVAAAVVARLAEKQAIAL